MLDWDPFPELETPLEDEVYRYGLSRRWGQGPHALWVLANPSTADANVDDRTILEVCKFTDRLTPYKAIIGVNLYARRATKPNALRGQSGLIGEADVFIDLATVGAGAHIVGWGSCLAGIRHADTPFKVRTRKVEDLLPASVPVWCLGFGSGSLSTPWHPLHAARQPPPGVGELEVWRAPAGGAN